MVEFKDSETALEEECERLRRLLKHAVYAYKEPNQDSCEICQEIKKEIEDL